MSTVRDQTRQAALERAVDRVMAAPGFDAQRSEAVAAIVEHGDFRVELPDGRLIGLSALPKWVRGQHDRVTRDHVRAAAVGR